MESVFLVQRGRHRMKYSEPLFWRHHGCFLDLVMPCTLDWRFFKLILFDVETVGSRFVHNHVYRHVPGNFHTPWHLLYRFKNTVNAMKTINSEQGHYHG